MIIKNDTVVEINGERILRRVFEVTYADLNGSVQWQEDLAISIKKSSEENHEWPNHYEWPEILKIVEQQELAKKN